MLSRPGDMTFAQEDHSLLHDLILIFILCFVLGALFANIGIPSHLAYMIAGTILGPSGYNVVTVSNYLCVCTCMRACVCVYICVHVCVCSTLVSTFF